jgi:hypothetical protein
MSDASIPPCVDLDGTLTHTDLLVESFLVLLKKNAPNVQPERSPFHAMPPLAWQLSHGTSARRAAQPPAVRRPVDRAWPPAAASTTELRLIVRAATHQVHGVVTGSTLLTTTQHRWHFTNPRGS